jgi:hypothetical protein
VTRPVFVFTTQKKRNVTNMQWGCADMEAVRDLPDAHSIVKV